MKTSPTPCRSSDAQSADLSLLKGLPIEDDSPVFREPWEAQAFGMALVLHERGLFTWDEWAHALSTQIRTAQAQGDPDLGNTYYRHWLTAIETLVSAKGISSPEELARYQQAWDHAAERVPHGQSVELCEEDFRADGAGQLHLGPVRK
jgi:nitrile hydratase accessory protein